MHVYEKYLRHMLYIDILHIYLLCCIWYTEEADLDAELACLEDELEGEGLEVDAQPAYLKPSTLPVQPSATPVTAPPMASSSNAVGNKGEVDEYGLPLHA